MLRRRTIDGWLLVPAGRADEVQDVIRAIQIVAFTDEMPVEAERLTEARE